MTTSDEASNVASSAKPSAPPPGLLPPALRSGPRRGPALIFLGVVAFVSIGGLTLAAVTSTPKAEIPASLGTLKGSSVAATSASSALARISVAGEPPKDVAQAIVLPDKADVVQSSKQTENIELYNGSLTINAPYAPKAVVAFYQLELAHRGWKVLRTDATANGKGSEIFATIPSSDGFYWEVEVVVDSASSAISTALGGGSVSASSHVEFQLIELNDQD
jgi:hypothetical protein